jgi:hypothetical protein
MSDVTRLLDAAAAGNPKADAELSPLVYDGLRKLAAARLADEKPGQTLQPTALVHEVCLRLVGGDQPWNGRGHFSPRRPRPCAASWSKPRRKNRVRHSGELRRVDSQPGATRGPG